MADEGFIVFEGNNGGSLTSTTGDASVSFTLGGGSKFCSITSAPHENLIQALGRVIVYWAGETRVFRDCVIDGRRIPSSGSGTVFVYEIRNRLWSWEEGGGWINGYFNLRNPDNSLMEVSRKSTRELVSALLEQLNEPGVDLSAVTNVDPPPEVKWDHARPYAALKSLLDSVGCRLALCPDDKVRIFKIGVGGNLPEKNRINREDIGVAKVARPDGLQLIGDKVLFEATFATVPVGLEVNDSLKELKTGDDLDVYYKEGPWEDSHIGKWGHIRDKDYNERARKSIYKWYRLSNFADGKNKIPGTKYELTTLDMINLRNVLIERVEKTRTDGETHKPAYLEGVYIKGVPVGDPAADSSNTLAGSKFIGDFSIDAKHRLVKTSQAVYRSDPDTGKSIPAQLFLRTSFTISDLFRSPVRYGYTFDLPNPVGAGYLPIRNDDIKATWKVPYTVSQSTDPKYEAGTPENNTKELDAIAKALFPGYVAQFDLLESRAAEYNGFQLIQLDGVIRQVTWSLSDGVATTRASTNSEREALIPRFDVLQRSEAVKQQKETMGGVIADFEHKLTLDSSGTLIA